jgi:hypothetical protein
LDARACLTDFERQVDGALAVQKNPTAREEILQANDPN